MHFQWYPGHMTKARRMMQENIKLIDIMVELVDARVPLSSKNPDIDELAKNKARLIVLNKIDMADARITKEWENYYKEKGFFVAKVNSRSGAGMKEVKKLIEEACRDKKERDRKRGILNRPVRAMIAGIPNVGKSTFINSFAGKACTKTGNKPGVTKGKQWIKINKNVELLDTPGILWPKFEDQKVGLRLAWIGSIKEEILDTTEMAIAFLGFLQEEYPGALEARYHVEERSKALAVLENIALERGCLGKGGQPDLEKAGLIVLDDYRSLRLGLISLEMPEGKMFPKGTDERKM
ncbi:MAG: ribosome biogenesis GTPase YlqF [Eubacteriales bacterium]|nr:ribosome biogenesis GTPase YlqF [Eubacteriales bacterium]